MDGMLLTMDQMISICGKAVSDAMDQYRANGYTIIMDPNTGTFWLWQTGRILIPIDRQVFKDMAWRHVNIAQKTIWIRVPPLDYNNRCA